MRRIVAVVVLMGGVAQAGPPPVCADPGVLRQVDELLRVKGRPMVLEPSAGEVSLSTPASSIPASPPVAHCAVRGHTVGYDTNRHGMTPLDEPFLVNYTVEMRHNGLFVSVP